MNANAPANSTAAIRDRLVERTPMSDVDRAAWLSELQRLRLQIEAAGQASATLDQVVEEIRKLRAA